MTIFDSVDSLCMYRKLDPDRTDSPTQMGLWFLSSNSDSRPYIELNLFLHAHLNPISRTGGWEGILNRYVEPSIRVNTVRKLSNGLCINLSHTNILGQPINRVLDFYMTAWYPPLANYIYKGLEEEIPRAWIWDNSWVNGLYPLGVHWKGDKEVVIYYCRFPRYVYFDLQKDLVAAVKAGLDLSDGSYLIEPVYIFEHGLIFDLYMENQVSSFTNLVQKHALEINNFLGQVMSARVRKGSVVS